MTNDDTKTYYTVTTSVRVKFSKTSNLCDAAKIIASLSDHISMEYITEWNSKFYVDFGMVTCKLDIVGDYIPEHVEADHLADELEIIDVMFSEPVSADGLADYIDSYTFTSDIEENFI